jgi:hypothetical protein
MSALLDEQLELEREALDHWDELCALADSTIEPKPAPEPSEEEPRVWTISGTPDEVNRLAYEARQRALEDSGVKVIGRLPRPLASSPTALAPLRALERQMIAARPRARGSRFRRVVRRIARRSARSPDPDEPDPPLGGVADNPARWM